MCSWKVLFVGVAALCVSSATGGPNNDSKGVLRIVNEGNFVMQWAITWKEGSTEVSWDKNWKDFPGPFSQDIELPGNAQGISVFARVATGLAWEWWHTVIDKKGIPLVKERTFTVSGTTLNPKSVISPSV
ncbi:alveolysin-like [Macrosteles quadrilineatus]|uniref:alveolysin-like n=1 Tax=Macrosteles quadrilineatus TaxID=74068 RepID=UPI0023E1D68B|nr:alveolysin-like [Macrosteles quadrilineatus]